MNNRTVFHLLRVIVLVLFTAGCAKSSASLSLTPELTQVSTPSQTPTNTQEPLPTATAIPTPTPAPIACEIVFESDRDGNLEIYSMAPDGSALKNLSNDPGQDSQPAWSPDGSQIAFTSNRENGSQDGQFIYVMNADGSSVRQFTQEDNSSWPYWSRDGSMITYTHRGDIYIKPSDGSEPGVNLTNSPEEDEQSAFSPDNGKIAWLSGTQGRWNLFVMDVNGNNRIQLTENGAVFGFEWTIDGEIFAHWDQPDGICFNCVLSADGSNVRDAGGKGELQRYMPFRTLNGERVECVSIDLFAGNDEIYLVSEIFPDIFLNLTNSPGNDRNPDWPANCLIGLEGAFPLEVTVPESTPTDAPVRMVIGYAGDTPEQKERAKDMQIACDELEIECIYGGISELIEKGVDAIIQNTDQLAVHSLKTEIAKAREKGIPVFLLDAETDAEGAYTISIDHSHWAKESLGWMLEKIGGKGQIAYFDLDPYHRYSETIQDLVSRYPGLSVVDFRDGDYDREKIKPETSDLVKQYPQLKAVWTSNDSMQAMWGLEENGIPYSKWPVMLCEATRDGLLTWKRIQAANPSFDCFASVNPSGIAYAAVYAAYYLESGYQIDKSVLGGEFGHTLFVNLPTVTKDNFQEKLSELEKLNLYYVDELISPKEIRQMWFLER